MRLLALALIRAYQRWVSPRKGFACAYRVHTGRRSCSALGYRAVRRHGVFGGLGLLRERTSRCGEVHRRHAAPRTTRFAGQRGDCDPGCDLGCDGGHGGGCDGPCDGPCDGSPGGRWHALDCCDCSGCDWPGGDRDRDRDRRRRRRRDRRRSGIEVRIPPRGVR